MSVNGLLGGVQGISTTTQGLDDVVSRLTGSGSFFAQLREASFGGEPFGVITGESSFGRRNAVHLYPFRDEPWVEDLGRQPREFTVVGWIVGDDVIARRDRLIAVCEKKVAGTLVHPTYGARKVALLDARCTEETGEGRVFRFTFRFMEQGARIFPKVVRSGVGAAVQGAKAANAASAKSFASQALTALRTGASAANAVAKQAAAWATQAKQAGKDVNALINLTATLPGEFGRLLREAKGVTLAQILPVAVGKSTRDLQGVSSAQRQAINAAADNLVSASVALGPLTTDAFSTAAQATAQAISANAPTPGDALLALGQLATVNAQNPEVGAALTARDQAVLLMRRAAIVEMAAVVVRYQPVSSRDAATVRTLVVGYLEAEMLVAGNSGDDLVYGQLRDLRTIVVEDLNSRGARLPGVNVVRTAASVPSLVMAQRLYQDASRETDLVQRARPVHPAFMPLQFEALAS